MNERPRRKTPPLAWSEAFAYSLGRTRRAYQRGVAGKKPPVPPLHREQGSRVLFDAGAAMRSIAKKEATLATGETRTPGMPVYNPDVLVQKYGSLAVYDDIRRDETVKGILKGIKKTRFGTRYRILPGADDDRAKQAALECEYLVDVMPGTLKAKLEQMALCMDYGVSFTEMVPMNVDTEWGPRYGIAKLAVRKPHSFGFNMDDHGNLNEKDGLVQYVQGMPQPVDRANVIIWQYDAEFDNPWGTSILQSIHRSWWSKNYIIQFWNQSLEMFSGPMVIITLPDEPSGEDEDEDDLREYAESLRGNSVIILPSGYKWDIKESSGAGMDAYDRALKTHNALMAAGLLFPNRLGFVDFEGGSYNLAETHMALWVSILEDFGQEVSERVMREGVFDRLMRWNGWPDTVARPRFVFEPVSRTAKYDLAEYVVKATSAGVLHWSRLDEEKLRELLDLPEMDEDVDRTVSPGEPQSDEPPPDDEQAEGGTEAGAEGPGDTNGAPGESKAPAPAEGEARTFAADTGDVEPGARGEQAEVGAGAEEKPKAKVRPLAHIEAKVDFKTVKDEWDELDALTAGAIAAVGRMALEAGTEWIDKSKVVERYDYEAATAYKLPKAIEVEAANKLLPWFLAQYLRGKTNAWEEVQRGAQGVPERKEFALDAYTQAVGLLPEDALKFLRSKVPLSSRELAMVKARAFYVTGVETTRMANTIKNIVIRGMEKGDVWWTKGQLSTLFDEYAGRGKVPFRDERGRVINWGSRAETVARTQFGEAYNMGRIAMFDDPAVVDMVEAYEWVSVLDDVTTDYCEDMDGRVFNRDEFEPPPAHFNCRSIVVPVLSHETYTMEKHFPTEGRGLGF